MKIIKICTISPWGVSCGNCLICWEKKVKFSGRKPGKPIKIDNFCKGPTTYYYVLNFIINSTNNLTCEHHLMLWLTWWEYFIKKIIFKKIVFFKNWEKLGGRKGINFTLVQINAFNRILSILRKEQSKNYFEYLPSSPPPLSNISVW